MGVFVDWNGPYDDEPEQMVGESGPEVVTVSDNTTILPAPMFDELIADIWGDPPEGD